MNESTKSWCSAFGCNNEKRNNLFRFFDIYTPNVGFQSRHCIYTIFFFFSLSLWMWVSPPNVALNFLRSFTYLLYLFIFCISHSVATCFSMSRCLNPSNFVSMCMFLIMPFGFGFVWKKKKFGFPSVSVFLITFIYSLSLLFSSTDLFIFIAVCLFTYRRRSRTLYSLW